ncbi:MAG: hypothetical protein M3P12_02935 [Gemmatimonadota bacterium]|nr:hypothetical protein [Gemmatimonadota bacterium]
MRTRELASAAGSSALLLFLLASASAAQERARQRAPIIRVYSENGPGVASNYVTPAIDVSEDSYVFAVMMDIDGHIQILQPDFPGISVRVRSHRQLRLPNFFAGFNDPYQGSQYGMASYNSYAGLGDDARGTVIALASRVPFNLELIEADGDWNISAVRRLIERRTPESAAQSLAQYIGAKGEPIGHDYFRFAGQRQNYYAYNGYNGYNDLAYCGYGGYGYSAGGAFYGAQAFTRVAQLRSLGLRPFIVGYDSCGLPIVVVAPFAPGGMVPFRPPVRPSGDTTVFPKSHFPQGLARRPSTDDRTPVGVFPLPQRGELPQLRDATISAPRGRRAEPREILEQFRSQPGITAPPERARIPIERTIPSRAEPATTATRPIFRPDPMVSAPSQPARMPERMREPAPAPVVHERPPVQSSPPPPSSPPPRMDPAPRAETPTTPPPRR